ncbi:hypothetical protein V6N13_005194 [Hibiscus sabdariffa]
MGSDEPLFMPMRQDSNAIFQDFRVFSLFGSSENLTLNDHCRIKNDLMAQIAQEGGSSNSSPLWFGAASSWPLDLKQIDGSD